MNNDSNGSSVAQNNSQSHALIILASGLSQRLGQPKQLLIKEGEPLIIYVTKVALASKAKTIIVVIPKNKSTVSSAINCAIETLITKLAKANSTIQIIANPTPELGMAQSLSLGIEALKVQQNLTQNFDINRVLIMGVDQVLLDSQHLYQLLAKDKSVVASSYPHLTKNFTINDSKDSIIGLPIAIDYHLLKTWQSALSGDKGLRHLIRALATEQISRVSNSQLSYDVDTAEQLAYAQQQGWLDH